MAGRLLERLEQSDLGVLGEVGGVVDDDDPPASFERPERQVLLHLADLLDRDELPVRVALEVHLASDHADVGVRLVVDLAAGKTGPAAAGDAWLARAEQRLREAYRHRSLADRPRAA